MQMYHLVTDWYFPFSLEQVWEELTDFNSWPAWWPDWRKLALRGNPGGAQQVGSIFDCAVRGHLPYTLRFTLEATRIEPPTLHEHNAAGGLAGTGKWVLMQEASSCHVQHHWHVGTGNPILNSFARLGFVRGLMEENHHGIMSRGYEGLKARLEQKVLA